jgi:hypothetical protein
VILNLVFPTRFSTVIDIDKSALSMEILFPSAEAAKPLIVATASVPAR